MVENFLTRFNIPEDVPIESKMVTNAIRSAQTQVEAQNFEIRKNVLKYDEVLNRQRTVIYAERRQVLEGADLHEQIRHMVDDTVESYVVAATSEGYAEEWDFEGLVAEVATYWPTELTVADLDSLVDTDAIYAKLMGEATGYFEQREESFGAESMREVERQVMLQIIDAKWRDHLYEMDYLQEGIHLRGLGQKDPLVEWQREGFSMFGQMMDSIADDYIKYLMHVQVVVEEPKSQLPENVQYSAAEDPMDGSGMAAAARIEAAQRGEAPPPGTEAIEEVVNAPVVKSEWDKTPRNAPCPCGSGKKFKQCHGAA
jgi:preprotein translocase subunit SecA